MIWFVSMAESGAGDQHALVGVNSGLAPGLFHPLALPDGLPAVDAGLVLQVGEAQRVEQLLVTFLR